MPSLPAEALGKRPLAALLAEARALHYVGVLGVSERARYVAGVYRGREEWTPAFDGSQFTLGQAWYTHLEESLDDEYFAGAAASDARVRRFVPGLQERLVALVAALVGAEVAARPGWCGPGVHIFPHGAHVAEQGGEVHCDDEGLTDEQLAARAPALTAIVMLQPPAVGGGLRVWEPLDDGPSGAEASGAREASGVPERGAAELFSYGAGDLIVIDSHRLHQIEPFSGALDRISATVHAVFDGGRWLSWF